LPATGCGGGNASAFIDVLGALIAAGQCQQASDCAAVVNESGEGMTIRREPRKRGKKQLSPE
jgi:hypothetical protein